MDAQKVDMFIMTNGKYFAEEKIGLGVAKLLTCGGICIWAIIDWFLILGATRNENLKKLEPLLL